MKFRAERAELVDAIQWVAHVAPRNPSQPVLASVRMTVKDGDLTLYAYDYDTSHQATLAVDSGDPGECLVPGSFLRDVVGSLKGDVVELVLDEQRLTATAGRSTYRVQTLNAGDYPRLPKFPKLVGTIGADALRALHTAVGHACDPSNALESVRGIRLEGSPDELRMLASDRFTLAIAWADWSGGDVAVTMQAQALGRALDGLTGSVKIGCDGGLVGFRTGDREVTVRCFGEPESNPWAKLPGLLRPAAEDAFSVEIDTADVSQALKRAGKLDATERVSVSVRPGEIEISAEGAERGNGSEVLDVDNEAGELTFLMGARRFAEAIAAAGTPVVRLGLLEPRKPVTIRPVTDEPHTELLVMPRHRN